MKTIIATTLVALSFAAPVAADNASDARAFFALGNDSAAERHVGATSSGNTVSVQKKFALTNTSPAENTVTVSRARTSDNEAVRKKFASYNDSPAEN